MRHPPEQPWKSETPVRENQKVQPSPVVLIDSREQRPLVFTRLPCERATLWTGDYSVRGMERTFSVERKSLDDLAASLTAGRERFAREMERLRGYSFRRLLLVGTRAQIEAHGYASKVAPAALLGSLAAWEIRYSVPVVFAATPEAAAVEVERWVWYAALERLKEAEALQGRQRGVTHQKPEGAVSLLVAPFESHP